MWNIPALKEAYRLDYCILHYI